MYDFLFCQQKPHTQKLYDPHQKQHIVLFTTKNNCIPYDPHQKQHRLLHPLCLMPLLFAAHSQPSLLQSAAQSCVPLSSAAIVRHRRLLPLLLSFAAAVFRCRHLCRSHHCHSTVSAIAHRPLLSFPVRVRRPILRAIVICRRCHLPPLLSTIAIVVRRCGLPPSQPSLPLSCLWCLLPPSSLPHCCPPPNLVCLRCPPPTAATAVVSSTAPFS
jgi:hypothetical protein